MQKIMRHNAEADEGKHSFYIKDNHLSDLVRNY